MDKREQMIEALEMSYRYSNVDEENTLVPQQLVLDVLALLKAQEPRVMTLEEVKMLVKDEVVYFQPNSVNPVRPRIVADVSMIGITFSDGGCWTFGEYGKKFYLWTSRPTDEQMEATPWE